MQQVTSKRLFQYWDMVRGARRAPRRFEIEPSQIADLLPNTFILECNGDGRYNFRLAGTQVCRNFGREMRGVNFAGFWRGSDREAVDNLLYCVVKDAGVGQLHFHASDTSGLGADFEMILLPLVHSGEVVNRLLGCITPTNSEAGLGNLSLVRFQLADVNLSWPDQRPHFVSDDIGEAQEPTAVTGGYSRVVRADRRCFRVYDGGLSQQKD